MTRNIPSDDEAIGIGAALAKARRIHGLGLDEAARATKLRPEQLAAVEAEDFAAVGSEVVVRGVLRTYAVYLGLRPEKVLAAYDRNTDGPAPPAPPGKMSRAQRAIAASRIRDDQRLLLLVAVGLVVLLLAFGLVSRRHSAPEPAPPPAGSVDVSAPSGGVTAVLVAVRDTDVTVAVDGEAADHAMRGSETISFKADRTIEIWAADGGAITVRLDERDLGVPGEDGQAWHEVFEASGSSPPAPVDGSTGGEP